MGKALVDQNLIWVVPCVGGIDYPIDQKAEPMHITILSNSFSVFVQYHKLRNITYVLLDAPIFRQQNKSEPYPQRQVPISSNGFIRGQPQDCSGADISVARVI